MDVTEAAREAGFRVPVALTQAAWAEFVVVPEGVTGQDERGRLWDVLFMLHFHIRRAGGGCSELAFSLYVHNQEAGGPESRQLKAVCGPDDRGLPCITVMLPGED